MNRLTAERAALRLGDGDRRNNYVARIGDDSKWHVYVVERVPVRRTNDD